MSILTVGSLKKKLAGLPNDTQVCTPFYNCELLPIDEQNVTVQTVKTRPLVQALVIKSPHEELLTDLAGDDW